MSLYTYTIVRDFGFAPNPFGGTCSLATCKPRIRDKAQIGDWIAGFGGKNTLVLHKMVYLMKVEKIHTYDEYWNNLKYNYKKPCLTKRLQDCYGDNIYHHDENGQWIQENSHHSLSNGKPNMKNLLHDTKIERVLLSEYYWYFGSCAILLPDSFKSIICSQRGYLKITDEEMINAFISWMRQHYQQKGQHGLPFSWKTMNKFTRYSGSDL